MVELEHHRFIWDQDQTPLGQPHSDTHIRSYVQKNQDWLSERPFQKKKKSICSYLYF